MWGKQSWLACGLLLCAGTAWPCFASCAELVVPTDFALLTEAVTNAADGDTITVLPGDHYLYEYMGLDRRDLVIRSLAGAAVTTLHGVDLGMGWSDIGFLYVTAATVFEGFTLRDFAGGAIYIWGGSPILRDLVIEDCGIDADFVARGGALHCSNSSPLIIGVHFLSNQNREGGAVWTGGGSPQFYFCRFEDNWAVRGGAVAIAGGSPSFIFCEFIANEARTYFSWDDLAYIDGYGGAVFTEAGASSFSYCLFAENTARIRTEVPRDASGGACYLRYASQPSFSNCTFVRNGADTHGGAFFLAEPAHVALQNSIVAFTTLGGGFHREGSGTGEADLACCDVFGNVGGDFIGMPDPTGQDGNVDADPLFCDLAGADYRLGSGSPCLPSHNDCGVQIGLYGQGCVTTAVNVATPVGLDLETNYPNPFNPSTTIPFSLDAPTKVTLTIHDVCGRMVRVLMAAESFPGGRHERVWDGLDAAGEPAPSGVYFYRLETPAGARARPMLLLK